MRLLFKRLQNDDDYIACADLIDAISFQQVYKKSNAMRCSFCKTFTKLLQTEPTLIDKNY
jgi:hypothetical protein